MKVPSSSKPPFRSWNGIRRRHWQRGFSSKNTNSIRGRSNSMPKVVSTSKGGEFELLIAPQVVYNAALSSVRRFYFFVLNRGGLAQLGEHNVRNVGVGGSNPLPSTTVLYRHPPEETAIGSGRRDFVTSASFIIEGSANNAAID